MSQDPIAARRFRRFTGVLAAAAAVLAFVAPAAWAALPITFESLPDGTRLAGQFPEVTFHDADGSVDSHSEVPIVADVGAGRAYSGTRVALSVCAGCEFEHHVMLVQLSQRAETASVRVGFHGGSTTTPRRLLVEALSSSRTLLSSTTVQATAVGFRTLATVDPPGTAASIAFLRLRTIDRSAEGERFGIDDLAYTSTTAALPDFAVIAQTAGVTIRVGGSATVPVDVLRFNGSSGPVTLSASSVPAGVSTRAIVPNPVDSSANASATVTLEASTAATPGRYEPLIGAAPGGPAVGPAARSDRFELAVENAFTVAIPGKIELPPCGSDTVDVIVSRARSGFTAPIRLDVGGLPAGYEATLGATTVTNPVDRSFETSVPLTIRATRPGLPADPTVTVKAMSTGLPSQTATATVRRTSGLITSMSPATGRVPQALRRGTLVELRGTGFCPGGHVEFGNEHAMAEVSEGDPAAGWIRARVPRLATTGRVTAVSPDGISTSEHPFTVISPRNSEGFSFENYDHPGVNLGIVRDLFGSKETNISVNPCWPFDCTIVTPVPSPLTGLYIAVSNLMLEDSGSCFGIAVTSRHIATGVTPRSRYAPSDATSVWELSGSGGPAPALARRIRTWHTAQLSAEFLGHWLRSTAVSFRDRGRGSLAMLRGELEGGRNPLVSIREGFSGHAVVAHDLVETPGGGYEIHVYDSNIRFLGTEDGDAEEHKTRERDSVITVSRDGDWEYPTKEWDGPADTMVVAPLSVLAGRLHMPTDPGGLATVLSPIGARAADIAQVRDVRGRALLGADGDVNRDARTRIPRATRFAGLTANETGPMYLLDPGGTYTQELRGTRTGTAGTTVLGPGFVAQVSGLRTRAGAVDRVRTASSSGAVHVGASSGGDLRLRLGRSLASGIEATADVLVAGGDRGSHGFRLDPRRRGGFHYANDGGGAATVRVTLGGGSAEALPGSVRLVAIRVPAGGRADARPSSWSRVGESRVGIRVRDARGRVVSRRTVLAGAPERISGVRLSTRTRAGDERMATVRVRFRDVPRGASVVVGVHARRGGETVASESLSVPARAGRRSAAYRVPITLPRGRYVLRASAAVLTRGSGTVSSSRATARQRFRAR